MDEKCNKLLNDILDEVNNAFVKTRSGYLKNGNTSDYIDRLGKTHEYRYVRENWTCSH